MWFGKELYIPLYWGRLLFLKKKICNCLLQKIQRILKDCEV